MRARSINTIDKANNIANNRALKFKPVAPDLKNDMNLAGKASLVFEPFEMHSAKIRRSSHGDEASVLADIYEDNVNMAIWQLELSPSVQGAVQELIASNPRFQIAMTVSPESALSSLYKEFGQDSLLGLAENIAELVDMFCTLFDLPRVGLRLTVLGKAMCPKFHVDKLLCRLITTYQGIATQWLEHQVVDRSKLGAGSKSLADNESGIYNKPSDIKELDVGDIALLSESWIGNENAGLVHRSPALIDGGQRLLLTLDFSD